MGMKTNATILALAIFCDKVQALSPDDRKDFFELMELWRHTDDPEELQGIYSTIEEILLQQPIKVIPLN